MALLLQVFSEVILLIVVIAGIGYYLEGAFQLDPRTLNRVSLYGLSPGFLFVTLLRTEINGGEALRLSLPVAFLRYDQHVLRPCYRSVPRSGIAVRSALVPRRFCQ